MTRMRDWRWPALATVAFLLAIGMAARHYVDAQTASDAATLRTVVADDGQGRLELAAMFDIGFALAYAALALSLSGGHRLRRVGAGVLVAGAVADVIENSLLIANLVRIGTISDGATDVMRLAGLVKWAGVLGGLALMLAGMALDAVQRRGGDAST